MHQWRHIVGTGGIGTGYFYALEGRHDIAREESRPAHRLDRRDYCKQHIILHYLAVLTRDLKLPMSVIPIGAVGDDEAGHTLLREMTDAGMSMAHVAVRPDAVTLSSLCYVFPDGSGGNFTENRSACEKVTPAVVARAWRQLAPARNKAMVLAAPEVPLATRVRLLQLGRARQAFTVASFVSHEIRGAVRDGLLAKVDLLALNLDEAAVLGGQPANDTPETIVTCCAAAARRANPRLRLTITAGRGGAFAVADGHVGFAPVMKLKAVNTAGAGDAFLSGVMLGLLLGLPLAEGDASCLRLGCALGGMKCLSPHTINFDINLRTLRSFLNRQRLPALRRALTPGT